jgi:hypothetical protein
VSCAGRLDSGRCEEDSGGDIWEGTHALNDRPMSSRRALRTHAPRCDPRAHCGHCLDKGEQWPVPSVPLPWQREPTVFLTCQTLPATKVAVTGPVTGSR